MKLSVILLLTALALGCLTGGLNAADDDDQFMEERQDDAAGMHGEDPSANVAVNINVILLILDFAVMVWILFFNGAEWLEGSIASTFLVHWFAPRWSAAGIRLFIWLTLIGYAVVGVGWLVMR